ncbi:hypothetical protein [Micromonospora tarensis]|uniref:Uncharacterized protein n=1 Tax=Micromonospora tarensis TaxID=2806100 RepID=A0ABS1YN17_9ACTN|nr:hypothetical protein [Micromonospora tarensis]
MTRQPDVIRAGPSSSSPAAPAARASSPTARSTTGPAWSRDRCSRTVGGSSRTDVQVSTANTTAQATVAASSQRRRDRAGAGAAGPAEEAQPVWTAPLTRPWCHGSAAAPAPEAVETARRWQVGGRWAGALAGGQVDRGGGSSR